MKLKCAEHLLLAVFVAAFITATGAFAADGPTTTKLYKITGPDGKVVYSDKPPAKGQEVKTLTFTNLPASPLSAATLAYIEGLKKSSAARLTEKRSTGTVLFSAVWCKYCVQAKSYLAKNRVPYREVDIDTKDGVAAYAEAGGGKGVPYLVADGKNISGFSNGAYDNFFKPKK